MVNMVMLKGQMDKLLVIDSRRIDRDIDLEGEA